ncbi:hypothetical protein HNP84_004161 [Thermocatellispora tengchongensis]|uniref:Uncharacterized protein n=1 Tax=Thermocatellispora tengchongensis TaxID=1073253 RepID=A0A840P612_9ACTN|nr:hypothetical protein [Thermocatellispora tengchongensis]MBB5134429.1 hypothetical protein [Thermocatellispora tengchongensis]
MTHPDRPRRRGFGSPIALAGWLFADLFLVLLVTSLGSQGVMEPMPEPTPSPSPTASPTRSDCPTSYELEGRRLTIRGISFRGLRERDPATRARLLAQVDAEVRRAGMRGRQGGLIYAYGLAPNAQRVAARDAALAAARMIKDGRPATFGRAEIENLNYETGGLTDRLYLDVYFLVDC